LTFGNPVKDAMQTSSGCEAKLSLRMGDVGARSKIQLPLHLDATLQVRIRGAVAAQRLRRSSDGARQSGNNQPFAIKTATINRWRKNATLSKGQKSTGGKKGKNQPAAKKGNRNRD